MQSVRSIARSARQRINYLLGRFPGRSQLSYGTVCRPTEQFDLRVDSHHVFFGYHDRTPFSQDDRILLAHAFRGALTPSVAGKASVQIGYFETGFNEGEPRYEQSEFNVVSESFAWSWQQATMLTWHPASPSSRIIFNVLKSGIPSAEVIDIRSGEKEFWKYPFYAVSPDGKNALSIDFGRLARMRAGYGIPGAIEEQSPETVGQNAHLWLLDTSSQKRVSVLDLVHCNADSGDTGLSSQYFNHAGFSPDGRFACVFHIDQHEAGRRIVFWFVDLETGKKTNLETDRLISHYCWLSPTQVLITNRDEHLEWRYSVYDVMNDELSDSDLGVNRDGHPMQCSESGVVVSDATPDQRRDQQVFLLDRHVEKIIQLESFHSPWKFTGPVRCDLHPRISRSGRWIAVDRVNKGKRAMTVLGVPHQHRS